MITVPAARFALARGLMLASKRAAPASAYGVSRRKADDSVAGYVLAIAGEDEHEAAAAIVQAADAVHAAYRQPARGPVLDDEDLDDDDL